MKANTRLFGEIDIADDKIITLEDGMIGLPEYRGKLQYKLNRRWIFQEAGPTKMAADEFASVGQ